MLGDKTRTTYMKEKGLPQPVIGRVSGTPAGNVVLEIGHVLEEAPGGWMKTEHVVLTPDEVRELVSQITQISSSG